MYRTLTNTSYRLTRKLFVQYSISAITLGLINACVPFSTDQYRNLGPNCWIESEVLTDPGPKPGFAMEMGLEYAQIPLIILMNAFLYYRIYKYMQDLKECSQASTSAGSSADKAERTIRRLQYYPCILCLCWVGMIGMRISQFINDSLPLYSYAFTEVGNLIDFYYVCCTYYKNCY